MKRQNQHNLVFEIDNGTPETRHSLPEEDKISKSSNCNILVILDNQDTPVNELEPLAERMDSQESAAGDDVKPKKRKKQTLEEKRMKGRIRSRNTRARKKNYIESLEKKVKQLEEENFKLQNVILSYRSNQNKNPFRSAKWDETYNFA